jgi:hypothetical protein
MVGSDRSKFKSLADGTHMPEARQESCKKDYARTAGSWDMVLKPFLRASDQPKTRIGVAYSDAEGDLASFARSFRTVQMLETVAQRSADEYAWPAPFTLAMQSCGRPAAAWSDETRTLRLCYELAFDFAELYRAYVPAAPAPTTSGSKGKRNVR